VAKGDSKKQRLAVYLERTRPALITEREWGELLRELAPVSESYLRNLLRASGLPLAPLVEGVRQDSIAGLERTLLALLDEYERGDEKRRRACRTCVIRAKDHARLAARRAVPDDPHRKLKDEMILWMLTWLENPGAFPIWVQLRKRSTLEACCDSS